MDCLVNLVTAGMSCLASQRDVTRMSFNDGSPY